MSAKVLIAHGDTHQLERAVRDLIAAGFEVVATPDGGDAFARFFEEDPDLVVCSAMLPVLDGRSFGRMIRSQSPDVPVVLLVADVAAETDGEFMCLQEPLDLAALSQLVPDVAALNVARVHARRTSGPVAQPDSQPVELLPGESPAQVAAEIRLLATPAVADDAVTQPFSFEDQTFVNELDFPDDVATEAEASPPVPETVPTPLIADELSQTETVSLLSILTSFQRQGNILALLDAKGLERFARIAELQARPQEDLVIREGDPCDGFYLLVEGGVRVTLAERGGEEVARLGSGEFFGEMALLSNQPRAATVWTIGPSHLVFFERVEVLKLLDDYPQLRNLLGGVALQRAEENLFEALADDDEVQSSLSELLDGVDEPDPIMSYPEPDDDPSADEQPEHHKEEYAEKQPVVFATLPGPSSPLAVGQQPAQESRVDRLRRRLRLLGHDFRLHALKHPLGVGLAGGLVGGVLLMAFGLFVYLQMSAADAIDPVGVNAADAAAGDQTGAPSAPDEGEPSAGEFDEVEPSAEELGEVVPSAEVPGEVEPSAEELGKVEPSAEELDEPSESEPSAEVPGEVVPSAEAHGEVVPSAGEPNAAAVVAKAVADSPRAAGHKGVDPSKLSAELAKATAEKRLDDVIDIGKQMASLGTLDAQSQYQVAEAAREKGLNEIAFAHYHAFATANPDDERADDALFWAAKALAGMKRRDEARVLFQKVADDPKSDMSSKAKKRVKELE